MKKFGFKSISRKVYYNVYLRLRWHGCTLGKNSFIKPDVKMTNRKNIKLGCRSYISHGCKIANDNGKIALGDLSHLAPNVVVNAYNADVTIGNGSAIGPNVSLIAHSNSYVEGEPIIGTVLSERIEIGDNVLIGANAVILPGVRIGDNSIVGAGSVVTKEVKDNEIVVGNPAKILKKRL